jgi:folate-binding Fe-S cluster repair protein YgfZ
MINFEVLGGVNFRKGCYPGQEIVARSQYLGKLKRRMLPALVHATAVAAGAEVYASTDPAQPCGQIVNAETSGEQTHCLVELKTAVLEEGASIHLGSADGPLLQIGALPYALIDPT